MKRLSTILRSVFAKRATLALFAIASVAQCFAAGNGMAGINEKTNGVHNIREFDVRDQNKVS